jgi:galactokinase
MIDEFETVFVPAAVAHAPGRVNLLGEHTDYNDGFVLPIALAQHTTVALGPASGPAFRLYSREVGETIEFTLDRLPDKGFARYVFGCLQEVVSRGHTIPALDIHVTSEVPIGVGLSSSAALEIATLRALRLFLTLPLDDVEIAQMAQRAEVDFAGVSCGIMDQIASSLADPTHALFLDARTLATERWPLPADCSILVLDSGVQRSLVTSAFNQRRRECEEACARLGVASLRDIEGPDCVEALPDPWRRRARHVVSENARVLRAVAGADAALLGQLMSASHASLRDDYEVSIPALDDLVALLQAHPAVYGAKLTGAGFGGACVAAVKSDCLAGIAGDVLHRYGRLGGHGRLLAPRAPEILR